MSKVNRYIMARETAGLSIAQAAKLLAVTPADLELYESVRGGMTPLGSLTIERLADIYHVDVEWLRGTTPLRDYQSIDRIDGADRLSSHDRNILAQFAASMPKRKS